MNTAALSAATPEQVLLIRAISKTYPGGTRALREVSLDLRPGRVHGLVGANGAGKSTLIKIIAGAELPTTGELYWHGHKVSWRRPSDAQAAGVGVVHQQSPVAPTLTVLENVFLGQRNHRLWRPAHRGAELDRLCQLMQFHIDPHAPVAGLSIGDRQMVSVLRALALRPSLLLLDEPTASISASERVTVLAALRRLAASGVAVVFVSHFLNEIAEVCDFVSVLRDGQLVDEFQVEALSHERLVDGIVGTRLRAVEVARRKQTPGPTVLEVRKLRSARIPSPISLKVRAGEILGIAGVLGSGRTSLLRAIFGADRRTSGEVLVSGRRLPAHTSSAVRHGVAFVPEDRLGQGLIPGWEIWRNISISDLRRLSRRFGGLNFAAERGRAARACRELGIVARSIDTPVKELSGGNAQKVVFAKWTYKRPAVLLLDEPTAGIDVVGKADLIALTRSMASEGAAIIIALSEFEELLSVADRVVVLHRGRIAGYYDSGSLTAAQLTAAAGGLS